MKQQAGYSKRTLVQKLGIKEGARMILINPPDHYDQILTPLPDRVIVMKKLVGLFDFIQYFTKSKTRLAENLPGLKDHLVTKRHDLDLMAQNGIQSSHRYD